MLDYKEYVDFGKQFVVKINFVTVYEVIRF